MKKNNIKYIKQTAAVLCAAVLMCGCSAPTADQGSGATAVNETSVSDTTDEADPDSQGNDASDPSGSITAGEQESLSSELYAMDTVMSLTAYGAHAKEALEAAETEISRLDKLLSISSESSDIYQVNQNGSGELSEDTRELLASALEYFQETDEEGAEELMKELGTPKEAARELMANLLNKKIEDHQNYETDGQTRAEQKGSGKHVVWIALLVLFAAPVGAPLLAAFAAVVLALVVCVFVILLCVVLCLMLIGGKILIRGILAVPFSMSGFAMLTGSGLLAVGAGILGVLLCVYLCKWSSMLIAKLVRRITGRKRERLER